MSPYFFTLFFYHKKNEFYIVLPYPYMMTLPTILLTGAPLLISFFLSQQPGQLYETITKPSWTPPPIVFPIVWTTLYLAMGYASSRVVERIGLVSIPILLYIIQFVLNIMWTPVFFGQGDFPRALAILRTLMITVVLTTVSFWSVDTVSGSLLLPYIVWLCVAHELNRSIVSLNPKL